MIGTNAHGKPIIFLRRNYILATSEFMRVLKRPDLFIHTKATAMFPELGSLPIYKIKERELRKAIKEAKVPK